MLRLITIPISHYCEKARWSLERAGIDYREERHVQAIHRFAVRRAGGQSTVPVLVTPDGVIAESSEILAWVDERTAPERRLFPARATDRSEVERLCRRFDEELGPKGRRLMYVHLLADRDLALRFNNAGVPPWEDRALRSGWPLIERVVRRVLDIQPGIEVEDEAAVWHEFDFVAELLADGRPHLCGERFGAADSDLRRAVGRDRRSAHIRGATAAARHAPARYRSARRAGARAPGRAVCARTVRRAPASELGNARLIVPRSTLPHDDARLENPAYAALSGAHSRFAQRRGRALRYVPDVAPFLALPSKASEADWRDATELVPPGTVAATIHDGSPLPESLQVMHTFELVQMIGEYVVGAEDPDAVTLGLTDVPEMLELVRLTEPGPFLERTIELGKYIGVRRHGALIAMAGERLRFDGWREISAVCTAPTYRGHGLASRLVSTLVADIQHRSEYAFLHVLTDNTNAIRLYEGLGFRTRRSRTISVLTRANDD